MKKLLSFMVTIAIIATIALLPAEGYSGSKWMLYDDFEDGIIDPDLWIIDPEGAPITNPGGEAKFEIAGGTPYTPYFLGINMEFEKLKKIKGIRATVRVMAEKEEYVKDITGGIGAIIGKWPYEVLYYGNGNYYAGYVWNELCIKAGYVTAGFDYPTIRCGLPVLIFVPQPISPFNIFYGEFGEFPPGDIPGHLLNTNITITMIFSQKEMTYEGSVGGKIIRKLGIKLDPSDDPRHFRGLFTTTGDGFGTADVYFDDVYILK